MMDHDSPMEQQVCVDILSNEVDPGCVDKDQPKPKSGTSVDEEENIKEKRKKASSAKKPPRPHRGFSLDAADHKLIKELAAIKRARIERMKALMQKKASKASSSANYSSLFAAIFTIVVFIVILFQGMSCQISCGTFEGSPPHETNETGFMFIREELNSSAHDSV